MIALPQAAATAALLRPRACGNTCVVQTTLFGFGRTCWSQPCPQRGALPAVCQRACGHCGFHDDCCTHPALCCEDEPVIECCEEPNGLVGDLPPAEDSAGDFPGLLASHSTETWGIDILEQVGWPVYQSGFPEGGPFPSRNGNYRHDGRESYQSARPNVWPVPSTGGGLFPDDYPSTDESPVFDDRTSLVPEPGSFILWSVLGVMGLVAARRRRGAGEL
jgi:hypothetical protein